MPAQAPQSAFAEILASYHPTSLFEFASAAADAADRARRKVQAAEHYADRVRTYLSNPPIK